MIDYTKITAGQELQLREIFSEWIDWFFEYSNIPTDTVIFIDDKSNFFNIRDYIAGVKNIFGFQSPCKEYLSVAYAMGGKKLVGKVLTATAPLVIPEIVIEGDGND